MGASATGAQRPGARNHFEELAALGRPEVVDSAYVYRKACEAG